jgi:cofilin
MCYPGAPKCEIAPDCIAAWDDLKNQKYRYILLTFSNDLEWIVVERRAPRESTYDEFLEELPPMDVRYALYDHEYLGSDGEHRNKLIFLVWAPDIAPVKRKLMMASTKFMLKNAVPGVCWETAGPDESDMPPTRLGG